ncbi:hypothetical protein MARA_00640 (plasmid) [Mycolicibacterium arabiense]|uniref:Aminoglycoside phosphotransferase domain-containing protein n=1 Tax=Mycolicibacterium arabiense TaxID=1286181 RepID=A0A7I7RPX4_9MYCO|nr:phosphotransferase [Mycolicibacterium arabiense]MCV7372036.1 phosphotransferase [Mycolicibacterium arabiense]BBY46634.1 hypothetical protein MARA_00640 [Mycolicibacterium arabiense]
MTIAGLPEPAEVLRDARLPRDATTLARQRFHLVASSASVGLVFRVGLASVDSAAADPCDVGRSHELAAAMADAGLNVLAPTTAAPEHRGRYVVSAFPLAEPLGGTGWRAQEPTLLGSAMTRWADFGSPLLAPLDIPGYTAGRIDTAAASADDDLREAAQWCRAQRESLDRRHPWGQLLDGGGCVHGDPNLGNLVRVPTTRTPLFIDLDSVKYGPRWYDLAVMSTYAVRFTSHYPWSEIMAGYQRVAGTVDVDVLWGLRRWKEFSSATQLLTRWSEPGIAQEFRRRTGLDDTGRWRNVTRTLVHVRPVHAGQQHRG